MRWYPEFDKKLKKSKEKDRSVIKDKDEIVKPSSKSVKAKKGAIDASKQLKVINIEELNKILGSLDGPKFISLLKKYGVDEQVKMDNRFVYIPFSFPDDDFPGFQWKLASLSACGRTYEVTEQGMDLKIDIHSLSDSARDQNNNSIDGLIKKSFDALADTALSVLEEEAKKEAKNEHFPIFLPSHWGNDSREGSPALKRENASREAQQFSI